MKLSFTTLGCPDWTFDKILSEAQRLGFQGIEIRGIENEMRIDKMPIFQPGMQRDTLRRFAEHGLTISALDSSVRFDDESKFDAFIEEGRAAVDLCHALGIPGVRVFGDAIPDISKEKETLARIAKGINLLCAYAEGTDVQIWLETHGDINTIERVLEIANAVPSKQFGLLWDVWHSDKVYGDEYPKFYQAVKHLVRHVHIKDCNRGEKSTLCLPGEGDIPLLQIAEMLIKDGYDGFFSFEWEKKWHPELPEPEVAFPAYAELFKGK